MQEGFTLVEILISVWIMGAIMVSLIGALFTMTRTSDINRKTTEAESEMRDLEAAVRCRSYKTKAANGNVCPTKRHLHQQRTRPSQPT